MPQDRDGPDAPRSLIISQAQKTTISGPVRSPVYPPTLTGTIMTHKTETSASTARRIAANGSPTISVGHFHIAGEFYVTAVEA